jgi:hypothetical protein
MVGLDVSETSGVDVPAHLTPGWVVLKAAPADLLTETTEETPVPDTATAPTVEVTKAADAACATCAATAVVKAAEPPSIEVLKAAMPAPLREYLATIEKAATDSAAREAEAVAKAAAEVEKNLDAEAVTKAAPLKDLGLDPEAFGPILRKFAGVSPEGAEAVEKALTAALNRGEAADLFTEVGKAATTISGSADEAMETLAKAAVEAGQADNLTKARILVAEANPDLYLRYTIEKKG